MGSSRFIFVFTNAARLEYSGALPSGRVCVQKSGEDWKSAIEELINGLECPKDFVCYKSGLQQLSKTRDIGLETFLICLENHANTCKFSVPFAELFFCQCPLRVYMAKKLKK